MRNTTSVRRGGVSGEMVAGFLIMLVGVGMFVIGCVTGWNSGYRSGQFDAAAGKMKYAKVETDDGVFWYDKDNPQKMWPDIRARASDD